MTKESKDSITTILKLNEQEEEEQQQQNQQGSTDSNIMLQSTVSKQINPHDFKINSINNHHEPLTNSITNSHQNQNQNQNPQKVNINTHTIQGFDIIEFKAIYHSTISKKTGKSKQKVQFHTAQPLLIQKLQSSYYKELNVHVFIRKYKKQYRAFLVAILFADQLKPIPELPISYIFDSVYKFRVILQEANHNYENINNELAFYGIKIADQQIDLIYKSAVIQRIKLDLSNSTMVNTNTNTNTNKPESETMTTISTATEKCSNQNSQGESQTEIKFHKSTHKLLQDTRLKIKYIQTPQLITDIETNNLTEQQNSNCMDSNLNSNPYTAIQPGEISFNIHPDYKCSIMKLEQKQ